MTHYPIFLINLDRQAERLKVMTSQLERIGLSATRIPAVDGKDAASMKASSAASYAPLTVGEIGCFESHRRFWELVAEGDAPGAYVLEDDMIVASDLAKIQFPRELLDQADIVKIDQSRPLDVAYGTHRITVSPERYVVRFLGTEMSTGCYFVTQKGARRLLQFSKNYFQPVDTFLFDRTSKVFVELNVWKLCDAAAVQVHMMMDVKKLGADFQDRIQGAARPEQQTGLWASWSRLRVRVRRFMDADTRQKREARARQYLQDFATTGPIETHQVEFSSPDVAHLEQVLAQST